MRGSNKVNRLSFAQDSGYIAQMAQPAPLRPRRIPWLWLAFPLIMAVVAGYVWLRALTDEPGEDAASAAHAAAPVEAAAAADDQKAGQPSQNASALAPPAALQSAVTALGRNFDGDVGIVVRSVDDGWSVQHNGKAVLPQQSLSKLWVAAATLARVDSGDISLDDAVVLTPSDLSIFHQPVRKQILASGTYRTTIADLLTRAITQSDNAANAALFERVGGKDGVEAFLTAKGIDGITMATSEKDLQMGIVGMEWRAAYSYGRNFWRARENVPLPMRMQTMGKYLADPPDGAAADAFAEGLAMLAQGKLLSPRSTAFLVDLMGQSKTGPKRLRGALDDGLISQGWRLPHKTGTGQVLKLLATAYNDVGILTTPDGAQFAIIVMIASTNRSVAERQDLMQAVTRSVIACVQLREC